jgi:hypothetical protein
MDLNVVMNASVDGSCTVFTFVFVMNPTAFDHVNSLQTRGSIEKISAFRALSHLS